MRRVNELFAWSSFALALFAWGGVALFAWMVSASLDESMSRSLQREQEFAAQSSMLRMHALARDTREAREQLAALVELDVVRMIAAIEAVGPDSGTRVEIGQALSSAANEEAPLSTIGLIVQAEGTYAAVVRAAAMLYSLPIPAAVDSLQFELLPGGKGDAWRLAVRLRLFTSVDLPSS